MDTRPLVPPTRTRQSDIEGFLHQNNPIWSNFNFSTYFLLGAFVQSVLSVLFPPLCALAPAALLLLGRFVQTLLVTFGLLKNPYLKGAVHTKNSAQIRDVDGNFHKPGQEKVAVLLLGLKSNHPLGIFEKGATKVGYWGDAMYKELETADNQDNGYLGYSLWNRTDDNGAREIVSISYWRSMDHVHAYALGPLHRRAIDWWWKNVKNLDHVGIMHELYEAPAGMWEGVAMNFQPTLLGKTAYLKRGSKFEGGVISDEWVSPLVDASRGPLKSHRGRLGKSGAFAGEGYNV